VVHLDEPLSVASMHCLEIEPRTLAIITAVLLP
jgi:hypothetical protein